MRRGGGASEQLVVVERQGRAHPPPNPLVLHCLIVQSPVSHSRRLEKKKRMNSTMSVICVLAMAIMASREVSGLMGSCREAKKCCEGKDPECGVTKVTDDDHDADHDDGSNGHDFDHNVDHGDDHVDQGQPQLDHHGSGRRTLLLRPQLPQHGRLLPRLQRLLRR